MVLNDSRKHFSVPLQNPWLTARISLGPDEWAGCLHPTPPPTDAEGWRRNAQEWKGREGIEPANTLRGNTSPSMASEPVFSHCLLRRSFLADLTHYASTPFWNPLSKQKQALLEKCINTGKSPDDNIIHFLMLFSDPSLGGPSLPASSCSSII